MTEIYRDIFQAIHEGKWLYINYRNQSGELTKYWIAIKNFDVRNKKLCVEGLHLIHCTIMSEASIFLESIESTKVIEGSYYPRNEKLINDIYMNPHKYKAYFDNVANLKILTYLEMCNRMDCVPYYKDYELIHRLDRDSFDGECFHLDKEQFKEIIHNFHNDADYKKKDGRITIQQLAMNVLSLHTSRGLYVLAYRKLDLDVKKHVLRPADDITICTEYTIDGTKENIRRYLDAEEYGLLDDFEVNQELIKDCITRNNSRVSVDDMPYMIGLGFDVVVDLHKEYQSIIKMYSGENDGIPVPIKAFFGELLARPIRRKAYPIALADNTINLDQLLAINNGMKYPVTYVQGPPGTGKTSTIVNTILTAFFNDQTVLFTSYNNHPIDGVFDKLCSMEYRNKTIPFPVLRLGNKEKEKEALEYIKQLYLKHKDTTIYDSTLNKNKNEKMERAKKLSNLLKEYEDILDLKERKETLEQLVEYEEKHSASLSMLLFQNDIRVRQLDNVRTKINEAPEITTEQAVALLDKNTEDFKKYLYYTSAQHIKKIDEPKNSELYDIVFEEDEDIRWERFREYLKSDKNIKLLMGIFPVIITTCISAHKLGSPEPVFDMVIMDEASQCNTAMALVPIIRGQKLMLVGDPQQLNPVILLNNSVNEMLKKKYNVTKEYDYIKNSIYKTYLACDSVSDEILLHDHYRCDKKIIEFNNRKYYNSKLRIRSKSGEEKPLVFVDIPNQKAVDKNTAPNEIQAIVDYIGHHKDQSIGIITPFVNQNKMIQQTLKDLDMDKDISCGTVHAFQGDEKDVILFSTAITDNTGKGTYDWIKNSKELINVATSRAKNQLIVLSDLGNVERLHTDDETDDLYELINYVRRNGNCVVTPKVTNSRALGIKPYSTKTEETFLKTLNHALENLFLTQGKYTVEKEVAIAHVFNENLAYSDLFYTGRFDFVVYEKVSKDEKMPLLAIELDGKEHYASDIVMRRDQKKNEICAKHNLELIRVENSYARRYNYIKEILMAYFAGKR